MGATTCTCRSLRHTLTIMATVGLPSPFCHVFEDPGCHMGSKGVKRSDRKRNEAVVQLPHLYPPCPAPFRPAPRGPGQVSGGPALGAAHSSEQRVVVPFAAPL